MLEGLAVGSHAEVLSCWVTNTPTPPPSQRSRQAPCRPGYLVVSEGQAGGLGGWGSLFSLQFMNKQNYSEQTHPQPESSWSKAYFEFIWCAIHYLLKMKKNDFYCTELLHVVIYLSAFCLKQLLKKKGRKTKGKRERKKKGTIKQKQPRATSMRLADGVWFHQRKSQRSRTHCASDSFPWGWSRDIGI